MTGSSVDEEDGHEEQEISAIDDGDHPRHHQNTNTHEMAPSSSSSSPPLLPPFMNASLRGEVKPPRAKKYSWVKEFNRVLVAVSTASLFIDPLFFYALSVSETFVCLFVDGWFAVTVTVLRCMADAFHLLNMWLQLNYHHHYHPYNHNHSFKLQNKNSVFFDIFVILPLPQIMLWVVIPSMLSRGSITQVMTVFLIIFLFQYLPKIYHSICLLNRTENMTGFISKTVWWGIGLNLIAYFVASNAAGACWYLLGIQRASKCLKEQCRATQGCGMSTLTFQEPIYYGKMIVQDRARMAWAENKQVRFSCIDGADNYDYGSFGWTVQLVTNNSRIEKILFPIFWGLMTLSTFGTLQSTTNWLEVVFNIIMLTAGLLLVTTLIGNIKVSLQATTSKKLGMHLKMRNVEGWMQQRKLPQGLKQRVRQYERQQWAAMRGVDEWEMTANLPEGLRREIKYHLCLDLVRQVPLFQHMDDLVLEHICDRVKSFIFPNGETIMKEGDPVERMLFVVRGHLQSSQILRDGVTSCCMLGPGNFSGDELLSWCLRRPFNERLPPSSSTLVTTETSEAFGLEAEDVKYVTQHFRYTFVKEKVRRSAMYYSPGWRTWAAVAIQLAWRRYKHRLSLSTLSFIIPRRPISRTSSKGEDRLRLYTALLTSPKPQEDEFC
ncbi:hypothetical protein Sjap_003570 [Stephania japonica]|uniref:Cyclic nucleotide-binding domain-containing protein n=1 Tax=Stephania japonica TaxID=461633 RepID=A0AAP0KRN4_9MAGN